MPGRAFSATNQYRYGFNGKENDKDAGEGIQDYGMRIYDTRIGKFLSVDPISKEYPWNSTYSFAEGDPINFIDLDGLEKSRPPGNRGGRVTGLRRKINYLDIDFNRGFNCDFCSSLINVNLLVCNFGF